MVLRLSVTQALYNKVEFVLLGKLAKTYTHFGTQTNAMMGLISLA